MKNPHIPYTTLFICLITFSYSIFVAFNVTGYVLGTVSITKLEPYGGITLAYLYDLQLWRLFAAQLIHVKQFHMLYNLLAIAALGACLERDIGTAKFFFLWLVPGAIGTLVGTTVETPPWNLGTGASQAVLGIAGFGVVLLLSGINVSILLGAALVFAIMPAFTLDVMSVGYPKIGHVTAAVIGAVAGLLYVWRLKKNQPAAITMTE